MRVVLIIFLCFTGFQLTAAGWFDWIPGFSKPTSIKLINNGYTGIVVAINRDVKETDSPVQAIKDMFIKGSSFLYHGTKNRAFFEEVTFIIPPTWSPKPEYQQAGKETYENADIFIGADPPKIPAPHVKNIPGCGRRGQSMHFVLDHFKSTKFQPIDRVLVHEWGHYWWGVYDEYPYSNRPQDHFYYSATSQLWEGTRCTAEFQGSALMINDATGASRPCVGNSSVGYEKGCRFYSNPKGVAKASIMNYQYYPQMTFCDNDKSDKTTLHNVEATNNHNRKCKHKSTWEVMREHPDFKDGNNPPRVIPAADIIPTFKFVQQGAVRVVLVLDVSGSMGGDRFNKMISASVDYISSVALDEQYVGIVQFNSYSAVLSPLALLLTDEDRSELVNYLPAGAGGGTCIGCGVTQGLSVLEAFGDPAGGVILLLSDGQDSRFPNEEVLNEVVEAGVIIDTIALGQSADSGMAFAASATGGNFFLYSEEAGDTGLLDALLATVRHADVPSTQRRIQLLSDSYILQIGEKFNNWVVMDTTIGNRTEFSFQWTNAPAGQQGIEVNLISPGGLAINSSYEGYSLDLTNRIISIKIAGTAEPGTWEFSVENIASSVQEEVFCTVSSYASNSGVKPIIVTSLLSGTYTDFLNGEFVTIYADVRQGDKAILYADVKAVVHRPGAYPPTDPFQLNDDGKGADGTENDGVYSAYFTQFTTEGFYGVKLSVKNDGKAIVVGPEEIYPGQPNLDVDEESQNTAPWSQPGKLLTGEPAPLFTRSESGGSTNVPDIPPGYIPGDDIIPPGRILDLIVDSTSYAEQTVTLMWSATGDDADSGTAQLYLIHRADTTDKMLNEFNDSIPIDQTDIIYGNLSVPQEFGNTETFIIKVPVPVESSTVNYAFAIQAVDDVGLESDISNIVSATLRKYIPPTGPPPTLPWTTTEGPTTEAPTANPTNAIPKPALSSPQIMGIAIGGFVLILVLALIIGFVCKGSNATNKFNQSQDMRQGETNFAMSRDFEANTYVYDGQYRP